MNLNEISLVMNEISTGIKQINHPSPTLVGGKTPSTVTDSINYRGMCGQLFQNLT